VNDAVDRLIMERQAMDHGFEGGLLISVFAHGLLIAAVVVAPLLLPKQPALRVMDGFAVPMPPGGGGARQPEPTAPAPPAAEPQQAQAPPEPAPKFLKPPSKVEPKSKGMPVPEAKKTSKKDKDKREDTQAVKDAPANPPSKTPASSGASGGTGKNPATPGLEFGPPGPGVPTGTDWLGDWYLAGVQRKIWSIWMQQIKGDFRQPITVRFTILADGSLGDVQVVESSGATMLDMAAKRAVYSAQPFGPLPKSYGTTSYTVQAIFKPSS
jgi:protein TonB